MSRSAARSIPIACLTCLLQSWLVSSLPASADELIGMPPRWMNNNSLWTIDRTNGEFVGGVAVFLPGEVVYGCYALAKHPTTGEVWALLANRDSDRLLCKIDVTTGEATLIGNTSGSNRRFATMAFNDDGGLLYAATGHEGSNQNAVFSLDQANASQTQLCTLSTSSFGQALAFNPMDFKLYRGSGSTIFQTIDDTATCATTGIGVTGAVFEFNSLTYHAGDNLFYVASFDQFSSVTAAGVINNLANLQSNIKGITPTSNPPMPPPCFPRADFYFTTENTNTNESFLWGTYADGANRLIGPIGFESIRAMDFGPDQRLYAIGERPITEVQVLIRIDPCTGAGTEVGPVTLGQNSATDMSFHAADSRLFVYNSVNRLFRVNQATGASTAVGNTGQSGSGNGIAFSETGTLFHADQANLSTLNAANGSATLIDGLDFPPSFGSDIEAMDFRPGTGELFSVLDEGDSNFLATINTADGTVTSIRQIVYDSRTIAVGPAPAICDIQSISDVYEDIDSGDWDFEDSCVNCDSGQQMLPFEVNIGGEIYTQFVQDSNGYVELYRDGETNHAFGPGSVADLTTAGDPDHTYLMAAYDNLDSSSFGQFGYHSDASRIIFFWKTETNADQGANNVSVFQIILWADGRVQWNFQTDEVAAFTFDLFSGLYLGYNRQQLFEIAMGDIPEGTSWLFGDCPIGSCCYTDGFCAETVESNCTGTWTEGGVCNPNSCPQPMGSCCGFDGSCNVTTQPACLGVGTWTLNGTCSPNPCPPAGSCCLSNGNCLIRVEANCNGVWTEGGVCDPDPCTDSDLTGACCLADASCQELTAADCDAAGGTYLGDGITCDEADCSTPDTPGSPCGQPMCAPAGGGILPMIAGLIGLRWVARRRRSHGAKA